MKKSIVISLLTVLTLLCTALGSMASTGIVTTDTLRLREEPSTDSAIIALLSVNDEVEIIEESDGWYKIQSGENTGYVATQYINVLTNVSNNETKNEDTVNQDKENNSEEESEGNSETEENQAQNEGESGNETEEVQSEENSNKSAKATLIAGEKLYITPIINSLVINTLSEEKQVEVISEINDWSYIKCGTTTGWVRTEKIQYKEIIEEQQTEQVQVENNNNSSTQSFGYISGSSVNFRKTANASGEVIAQLPRNTKVTVITKDDTWVEIEYNGEKGYVSADYISDTDLEVTSRSAAARTASTNTTTSETQNTAKASNTTTSSSSKSTASSTSSSSTNTSSKSSKVTGDEIVSFAKQYLGYKYTYGGASPSTGFDCSGFTTYIFKHFGISINRTASGQASNGTAVSKSNLQAGDIICFSNSSSSKTIGHVGIYIGGGKFIHSANSRKGVITSKVSGDGFYFVTARRVI